MHRYHNDTVRRMENLGSNYNLLKRCWNKILYLHYKWTRNKVYNSNYHLVLAFLARYYFILKRIEKVTKRLRIFCYKFVLTYTVLITYIKKPYNQYFFLKWYFLKILITEYRLHKTKRIFVNGHRDENIETIFAICQNFIIIWVE